MYISYTVRQLPLTSPKDDDDAEASQERMYASTQKHRQSKEPVEAGLGLAQKVGRYHHDA